VGHRWSGQSAVSGVSWPADPGSGVASAVRLRARLGLPSLATYAGPETDLARSALSTVAVSTFGLRMRLGLGGS